MFELTITRIKYPKNDTIEYEYESLDNLLMELKQMIIDKKVNKDDIIRIRGEIIMNKEKLTDYVFKFWDNWGAFNFESATDEEIKNEIKKNLSSLDGIEKELDYVRLEFENGSWDENSKEYKDLDKLWDYLNWYKTNFKGMKENGSI